MSNSPLIQIHIYSYKNKNLANVVKSIQENTINSYSISLVEQHPLTHADYYKDISNLSYEHVFWDHQYSPAKYRAIFIAEGLAEYQLMLSDDVILSSGWDEKLINFIDDRDIVVSGSGAPSVKISDKYFLKNSPTTSADFSLSQFIDRNFIFAKRSILMRGEYPMDIKYLGEGEVYTLRLFCQGIDIYSTPTGTYEDLGVRTLENLYAPFSIEHNYNSFIDMLKGDDPTVGHRSPRKVAEFLDFHNIDRDGIIKIPYQNDDVLYDPNKLKIQNVGGERFIANTKAIY